MGHLISPCARMIKCCGKPLCGSLFPALLIFFFYFYVSPSLELLPHNNLIMLLAAPAVPECVDIPFDYFSSLNKDLDLYDLYSEEVQALYPFAEPPVLLESVTPIYPELSRQANIEGTILLRGMIGEDGRVLHVSVIESDANAAMQRAAMAAAIQFRFRPAKQRSVPVKVQVAIPFRYKLR